jgi:uncharacterized membrane protein
VSAIIEGTAADTMPPLHYFLLKGWTSLAGDVWFMRLLSVLLSLGIVVLVYAAVSRWFDRQTGFIAALFTAVSPFQIYHAQEIRMYTLLTIALLAYFLLFTHLWEKNSSGRTSWLSWIVFILSGTTAMYTHNLAVFTIIVPNFILLVRREWRFLWRIVRAQIVIAVLLLPWLVYIPKQIMKIQTAFWTPLPGLVEVLQAIITFHTNLPLPTWLIPIAVFTSVLSLTLVFYEIARIKDKDRVTLSFIWGTLLPPLFLFIASYLMRPLFVPRVMMLSSLTYLVLAARVVRGAGPRMISLTLSLLIIVPALASLPSLYTYESFPRSPFRSAADDLAVRVGGGDVVIHDNKLSYFPMHFYHPEIPQDFLPDIPESPNDTLAPQTQRALDIKPVPDMKSAIGGAERVWFVVFERAIEEYAEISEVDHPQLLWLHDHLNFADLYTHNDLLIYEFTR